MSKREQFKSLLGGSESTGAAQKKIILEHTLLNPPSTPQISTKGRDESVPSGNETIFEDLKAELNGNDSLFTELYTRKTFYIENELLKDFYELVSGKNRGFQTKVINKSLKIVIDLIKEGKL